jgi:hypothetical protein
MEVTQKVTSEGALGYDQISRENVTSNENTVSQEARQQQSRSDRTNTSTGSQTGDKSSQSSQENRSSRDGNTEGVTASQQKQIRTGTTEERQVTKVHVAFQVSFTVPFMLKSPAPPAGTQC